MGNTCQRKKKNIEAKDEDIQKEMDEKKEESEISIGEKINEGNEIDQNKKLSDEELMQILRELQAEIIQNKKNNQQIKSSLRSKLQSKIQRKQGYSQNKEEPQYFYRYVCQGGKENKVKEKYDVKEYYEDEAQSTYVQNLVAKLIDSHVLQIDNFQR